MSDKKLNITKDSFKNPIWFLVIFFGLGFWRYFATGNFFFIWLFGYIGFSIAIGAFLTKSLIKKYKPIGRKISQLLVGLFMLGFLGFLGHENMQIEGFFFYLFAGVFAGATLHYFIAKLVGPFFFGRAWCSWACWTVMVMDFFPWKKPEQGRVRKLGLLRYVYFFISLAVIIYLVYYAGYTAKEHAQAEIVWLTIGNASYYILAIILAIAFKDNRAFCKYICPIPITQKILSRFSLMKQEIDMDKCTECMLCEKHCLMNIKLLDYAKENKRVLSTECILCDTCVNICPTNAIDTTKKFDFTCKEYINFK